MTLKIDLVMFRGVGEAGCNLTVWRGDVPTKAQLKALQDYLNENNKGDANATNEESEFI